MANIETAARETARPAAKIKGKGKKPVNLPDLPKSSLRATFVTRRTYLRPLDEDGKRFETEAQALDRVMGHQRTLWEDAQKKPLTPAQEAELDELRHLIEQKRVSLSGRVKWMGGTALVRERAAAAFNCAFKLARKPADLTDIFWLLLQGTGVGFRPVTGILTGFPTTIADIQIVPSTRTEKGGAEDTVTWVDHEASTWTIKFGDSAKAWAKAIGKLTTEKPRVTTLVLDFSELRPGGKRLRGYGWLSSGWEPLMRGMTGIAKIMMRRAGEFLTPIDIGDIINWLGTVLSSRRSAQIWLQEVSETDWANIAARHGDFIHAKTGRWEKGEGQREQSNNSLVFNKKPDREVIVNLLHLILDTGEPGFVNGAAARARAPEMEGLNPCAEILLPSAGFCNLVQVVWHRFNGDYLGLQRAQWIAARANYRQACVSMRDGVLQLEWNDNQKLLRLCGVSPTGYVSWEYCNDAEKLEGLAAAAIEGANSMADELDLQRPARVTQCQPAGTSSKSLGIEGDEVHEGAHCADSRWLFNNVNFSKFDPMVARFQAANYRVFENPNDPTGMIVTFPVEYPASPMFKQVTVEKPSYTEEDFAAMASVVGEEAAKKALGPLEMRSHHLEINEESALSQLERYRILMNHYVQHNCSITVSFDAHEIEGMADWFMEHWDEYVGVSFLKRNNPMRTAKELGFAYLPQEAVSREDYEAYVSKLAPVDTSDDTSEDMLEFGECASGACPIR